MNKPAPRPRRFTTDSGIHIQTPKTWYASGLRAGTYTRLFEGTSSFAQRGLIGVAQGPWKVAAGNAAKAIENWIKANHDSLLSRRSDVQLTVIAARGVCIPDMRTPDCRAVTAKGVEARLHQNSPDIKVSVEGAGNDILVEKSQSEFDDPRIRNPSQRKELEKALCVYAYKRVVIVNPSNMAKYEFELNCPTNLQTPGLRDEAPISSPDAATGTVSFASIPDGADIYVDGEFMGNSPATLKLKLGNHTVSATMSGYQDWNREITVSGAAASLNAKLMAGPNPPASNSGVTTRPEPARITQEESGTGWIGVTTKDDSAKGVVITRVLAGRPSGASKVAGGRRHRRNGWGGCQVRNEI